jgi:site-specific DNA-methyltransferase (adenine-specific)
MEVNKIYQEDCRSTIANLPEQSLDLIVTSPPYLNLRNYKIEDEEAKLGEETDYREFIKNLVDIFISTHSKLKDTGSLWVNIGDTYKSSKQKCDIQNKSLMGIPDRFNIAMIDAGFCLRNEISWHKPNSQPTSAKDRFTIDSEKFYWYVKKPVGYYFEQQLEPYTIVEKIPKRRGSSKWSKEIGGYKKGTLVRPNPAGRNMRTTWNINTECTKKAHFATYPKKLIYTPIVACCPEGGIVYDPFMGSGTTAEVCIDTNRKYVGSELSSIYHRKTEERLAEYIKQKRLI